MEVEYRSVQIEDFIHWEVKHYNKQRFLSREWVEELVRKQEEIYQARQLLIVPGVFTFVKLEGELYLIDGQHRWSMLKTLEKKRLRMKGKVGVSIYDVGDSTSLIDTIYYLLTKQYGSNGTFDEEGKSFLHLDQTSLLIKKIQESFPSHFRSRITKVMAPYFDPNDLATEINKHCDWEETTVEEAWEKLLDKNLEYGEIARHKSSTLFAKARDLEGFFLSIGYPKCKWVKEIFK